MSSSLASIYNAVTPITTAILATLAFRVERLNRDQVLGVAVGIVGVVIVVGPWQIAALTGSLWGQLACLGAVTCYGFSFGYIRRFISHRDMPATTVAVMNIGVAAVIMLLLTPVRRLGSGHVQLAGAAESARARRARHGRRLHLEHERAAGVGPDRDVGGDLRHAGRRCRAGHPGAAASRSAGTSRWAPLSCCSGSCSRSSGCGVLTRRAVLRRRRGARCASACGCRHRSDSVGEPAGVIASAPAARRPSHWPATAVIGRTGDRPADWPATGLAVGLGEVAGAGLGGDDRAEVFGQGRLVRARRALRGRR